MGQSEADFTVSDTQVEMSVDLQSTRNSEVIGKSPPSEVKGRGLNFALHNINKHYELGMK